MPRTAITNIDIAICDATNEALVHSVEHRFGGRSALTTAAMKIINAVEVSICELADAAAAAEREYRRACVAEVIASFSVPLRAAAVAALDAQKYACECKPCDCPDCGHVDCTYRQPEAFAVAVAPCLHKRVGRACPYCPAGPVAPSAGRPPVRAPVLPGRQARPGRRPQARPGRYSRIP